MKEYRNFISEISFQKSPEIMKRIFLLTFAPLVQLNNCTPLNHVM